MGTKFFVVALEGDFRHRLGEIAQVCGRRPVGDVRHFNDWKSVAPFVKQEGYLGAACSGAWTVLTEDGEMTCHVFDNPEIAADLASRFDTRVVSAFGHSVSGGCGFCVHTPAGCCRSVLVTQEGVLEDDGELIPGEEPVDPEDYNEYSVLDTLELLGLDIADGVESSTRCALLQLATKRGQGAT